MPVFEIWVWARTRTTVQYFLILSSSREMALPSLSECFLAYFVNAFFLGTVPGLEKATLHFIGKMLGPDGSEGTKSTRSLDVTDDTDDHHGRSFQDGDSLDNLLLVHLGSGSLQIPDNMRHPCLVSQHGGQVDLLRFIILGECLYFPAMTSCPFPGQETQRTVPGVLELPVRHF